MRNGIYNGTLKKAKPVAKILATAFGILSLLLIIFIIWSAVTFGGADATFVPQAQEISELKIQVESQAITIDDLRAEIASLEEELAAEKKKNAELTKPEEPPADEVDQPISGENVDSEE